MSTDVICIYVLDASFFVDYSFRSNSAFAVYLFSFIEILSRVDTSLSIAYSFIRCYQLNSNVCEIFLIRHLLFIINERSLAFAANLPRCVFEIRCKAFLFLLFVFRDTLYRLTIDNFRVLQKTTWPATPDKIGSCLDKGQSEEDCRNYVKVLLSDGTKLFTCGTNAFSPICSWREVNYEDLL